MTSDEKRREIAVNLRYLAEMCENVLDSDVLDALDIGCGYVDGTCRAYDVEKLADLIDRPTCRNNGDRDDRGFVCSACGYEAWTFYDSNCDPSDFSFCPDCGAVVVDKD